MSKSPHVFPIGRTAPQFSNASGSRTFVNRSNFPILQNLSLYKLRLEPGAFREPHWHANAHELAYCLAGRSLVTIFSNGNLHDTFTIDEGEMFFVPSGYLHAIENVGDSAAEFVIAFTHHDPEDFGISGAVGCMTPSVMGNTWGLPESAVAGLRYSPEDILIGKTDGAAVIPPGAAFASRYKIAAEALPAMINNEFGSARTVKKQFFPVLENIAMFSLRLEGTGMREPHWHPQTAEMGYVLQGRARMTILSPGASVDTYELEPGDMYFIPKAYPHHIENLDGGEVRFLIFFDQATPEDIGYTGGIAAYPRRIVAPTLGCTDATLPAIPSTPSDLMVVGKTNPVAN